MIDKLYLEPNIGFIGDTAKDLGFWDMIYPIHYPIVVSNKSISEESSGNFRRALEKLLQEDSC